MPIILRVGALVALFVLPMIVLNGSSAPPDRICPPIGIVPLGLVLAWAARRRRN